ncbi:MAG: hypothetical protein WCT41_02250 [Candidatus Paceibacterota bacterium]|jgi:hypothetical protein
MALTLLAAKILGIYLVVGGLMVIIRGKTLPHLMKDFFGHPAVVYLTGVILITLSSVYLLQKNVWDGSWRTIITVLMWATLVKGLSYIFIPGALEKMVNKKLFDFVSLYGLIAIAGGIYLFYLG